MTLEQALKATVTEAEARAEVEAHGALWSEFVEECGIADEYSGERVLAWLGY